MIGAFQVLVKIWIEISEVNPGQCFVSRECFAPQISKGSQGSFVSGLPADTQPRPFGATKWCIFHPAEITYAKVAAAVKERSDRMRKERVDLLQVRGRAQFTAVA